MKEKLRNVDDMLEDDIKALLDPDSPQRLMYAFYIVDYLGRPVRLRRHSGVHDPTQQEQVQQPRPWAHRFAEAGGLRHLFDIFMSGALQAEPVAVTNGSHVWCEWRQDCLSALIKLLVQFGVDAMDDGKFALPGVSRAIFR